MKQEGSDPGSTKRPKRALPGVTAMPEFGGLRVVESIKVDGVEPGELIPWQRLHFHHHQGGTTVFLSPDQGKRRIISIKGGSRGSRLAARLKARWSETVDDDPLVCYEPRRQSFPAFLGLFVPFGGLMLAGGIYLCVSQAIALGPLPWSVFRWIAFFFWSIPLVGTAFMIRLIWRTRPREPQYERIAVSETGVLMEGGGPTVDLLWSDVRSCQRILDEPIRYKLTLASGEQVWLVVPKRVRTEVVRRMPERLSGGVLTRQRQRQIKRRMALRFVLYGFAAAGILASAVLWLGSRGFILPVDVRRLLSTAVPGIVLFVSALGVLMLWEVWRSTPKGRRAVRRWSRRVCPARRARAA